MFDDFSLVSCSYDTPHVTLTMLKSWKEVNGKVSNKIFIVDNSNNEETSEILKENDIKFKRNNGGAHFNGVQIILNEVTTRYVLLVDTDVIFNKDISPIFEMFKKNNYTIMGEVCGDRGGQSLFPRIHPWFCFIDVEQVRKNRISFINPSKIRITNSDRFYGNNPINPYSPGRKYDVGATFLEDIMQKGLKAYNIKLDPEYYFHYEGMSWRGKSGIPQLINAQKENEILYQSDYEKYKEVDIKGWFK